MVVALLLASWQIGSVYTGPQWISSPLLVSEQLLLWFGSGEILYHLGYTLLAAVLGFLIGAIPGAILPFAIRRLPFVAAVLEPFMLAGYAIPKLALIPILVIWFGIGIWSKVALVASVSFFLVYFNTMAGVRSISPHLVRVAEIMGASDRQVSRLIVFPATLAFVFNGIRVSLPLSIGGAAIAEMFTSNAGLGYLIQLSATNFDPTGSFAALAVLAALVAGANIVVDVLEGRLQAWKPKNDDLLHGGLPT
ncbi:ABC transporter permease [Mesorhizobium sp. J428]|uniref:ABC transporter permease n=1 Tax=Mesorhizobium sp. J428 TaxID=2898440 RepID=UPI002151BCFF|nr:ABC transporter permease [Mesorhizobium sp. J428]MCR5857976.1 ABC transporter permease [Mesorhizobium sp. J428]